MYWKQLPCPALKYVLNGTSAIMRPETVDVRFSRGLLQINVRMTELAVQI